jgi:hypothetical protein
MARLAMPVVIMQSPTVLDPFIIFHVYFEIIRVAEWTSLIIIKLHLE